MQLNGEWRCRDVRAGFETNYLRRLRPVHSRSVHSARMSKEGAVAAKVCPEMSVAALRASRRQCEMRIAQMESRRERAARIETAAVERRRQSCDADSLTDPFSRSQFLSIRLRTQFGGARDG